MENKKAEVLVIVYDGVTGKYLHDSRVPFDAIHYYSEYVDVDKYDNVRSNDNPIVEVLLFIPICTHYSEMVLSSVLNNIKMDKGCSYNHNVVWTDYIDYPCHMVRIRKNGKEIKAVEVGSNQILNKDQAKNKSQQLNINRKFNVNYRSKDDIISNWEVPEIYTSSTGYRMYTDLNHDNEIDRLESIGKIDLFSVDTKYRPIASRTWIIKENEPYKVSEGPLLFPIEYLESIERDGGRFIFKFTKPVVRIRQDVRRDLSIVYREKLPFISDDFIKLINIDINNKYINVYDYMMVAYEHGKVIKPNILKGILKSRFRYNL